MQEFKYFGFENVKVKKNSETNKKNFFLNIIAKLWR